MQKLVNWPAIQIDFNSGLSEREIATKHGISTTAIFKAKQRKQITTRTRVASRQYRVALGLSAPITHSEATKAKIANKLVGNKNGKHQGNKRIFYKGIQMDSSWEAGVARYFDEQMIVWAYEEITYQLTGNSSYTPDFFVYQNGILTEVVEVKGYWREKNLAKFQEFMAAYPDIPIQVWDREKLKSLNIVTMAGYLKKPLN